MINFSIAGRISAHKAPLNTGYWRGFSFLLVVIMDTIEAKKNLNALCNEIEKLQNLSRGLMTAKEMVEVDAKIKRHKEQVKNIRSNLYA
ncbi:hypothetical protein DKE44_020445 (plasmid) [Acinetobacter nosocomialis]|nr:hypothetical protein DKE44_020445 [Acinetobacter nosocomialis]